jgi:hypothetical protein
MKAKALIPSTDKYRSRWERAWATFGKAILEQDSGSKVVAMDYEPETFNLPGGSYTPDFRAILDDGTIVFIEVKANKYQKNYRDARSKLRAAQELNPYYAWMEARITIRRGAIVNCELEVIG